MRKNGIDRKNGSCIYCHRGGNMQGILFFLTVFCGIFGAYILAGMIYNAVISLLGKGRSSNGGKHGRNNNDNRHGRGNRI